MITHNPTRMRTRLRHRLMLIAVVPSLAIGLSSCAVPGSNYSQNQRPAGTFSRMTPAAAPATMGMIFSEANTLKPGTDVVILHRNFYAGETQYNYTRGTFQSWGEPLDEAHEVTARVDYIKNRHDVNHPMSMYRQSDMSALAQSPNHYANVNVRMDGTSRTARSINMDHVVAIVPADQIPTQYMAGSNGTIPQGTIPMPAGQSASTNVPTLGGSTGQTASTGSTRTTSTGRTGTPTRTRSSTASTRSGSGGSGCPVAPASTGRSGGYGNSSGTSTRVASGPRVSGTSTRSAPRATSSGGGVSSSGGKKRASGGPR